MVLSIRVSSSFFSLRLNTHNHALNLLRKRACLGFSFLFAPFGLLIGIFAFLKKFLILWGHYKSTNKHYLLHDHSQFTWIHSNNIKVKVYWIITFINFLKIWWYLKNNDFCKKVCRFDFGRLFIKSINTQSSNFSIHK